MSTSALPPSVAVHRFAPTSPLPKKAASPTPPARPSAAPKAPVAAPVAESKPQATGSSLRDVMEIGFASLPLVRELREFFDWASTPRRR